MESFAKLRHLLVLTVVLAITFLFTGCVQVEQIIHVKADGSGALTLTMIFTKEAIAQTKKEDEEDLTEQLPTEEAAKTAAADFGEGVKFESREKIKTDAGEGVKVVYSFADITKLKTNFNMADLHAPAAQEGALTFEFTKGSPAKLVAKTLYKDLPKNAPKPEEIDSDPDDEAFAEAWKTMKGMKVKVAVEVEGTIGETNAAYHDAHTVTLMDAPFDTVLKDRNLFKKMNAADGFTEGMEMMKKVPGIKVDLKKEIAIQFK